MLFQELCHSSQSLLYVDCYIQPQISCHLLLDYMIWIEEIIRDEDDAANSRDYTM